MKLTQNFAIVFLFLLLTAILGVGVYSLTSDRRTPPMFACTMDALVCPDGSAVGRTGPSCTFAACPTLGKLSGVFITDGHGTSTLTTSAERGQAAGSIVPLDMSAVTIPPNISGKNVTLEGLYATGNTFVVSAFISPTSTATSTVTSAPPVTSSPESGGALPIGGSKMISGVKVTFNHIVSDSRCPTDVQCIQAGSVTANVTLQGELDTETVDISSQQPHVFGKHQVAIVRISPERKNSAPFDTSSYRIVFAVTSLQQ